MHAWYSVLIGVLRPCRVQIGRHLRVHLRNGGLLEFFLADGDSAGQWYVAFWLGSHHFGCAELFLARLRAHKHMKRVVFSS